MRAIFKTLAVGSLAAAPMLFMASPAHAFTNVSVSGGTLTITSGNAADNITISRSGGFITIANPADAPLAGGVCTRSGSLVRCPSAGVRRLSISTGAASDTVTNTTDLPATVFLGAGFDTYNGGSGADLVFGGAGQDTLNGNGGNDTLDGGPDSGDRANGGAGSDICQAESETSCER